MSIVNCGAASAAAMRKTAIRASEWLCLAAAPAFAAMAVLAGLAEAGHPDMLCSASAPLSGLSGMVPMYLLMSVFHSPPWLKRILDRRDGSAGPDAAPSGPRDAPVTGPF